MWSFKFFIYFNIFLVRTDYKSHNFELIYEKKIIEKINQLQRVLLKHLVLTILLKKSKRSMKRKRERETERVRYDSMNFTL